MSKDPQGNSASGTETHPLDELIRRCKDVGFETKVDPQQSESEYIEISVPAGREKRLIYLIGDIDWRRFLAKPFERYNLLSDYYAICSYEDATIEADVRPLVSSRDMVRSRLFSRSVATASASNHDISPIILSPESREGIEITLGPASETLKSFFPYDLDDPRDAISVRLSGARVFQHDQAVSLLERVSNSVFFQIDLLTNIPLALSKERSRFRRRPVRRKLGNELQYPQAEYDKIPSSLYWYAKSAGQMPLLQFLAFYQVIEFYFPTYYQAQAHRRIRSILKDPLFRSDRDADLSRICSAIQLSRSGALGDERTQFRATLNECIAAETLTEFIAADENRKCFLSSKTKGLTDRTLKIRDAEADLRNEVADRLYDIRCKIVHTKNDTRDGEIEILLPFSKEEDQLHHDIALIEFIAQRVLIAASTPFRW
jgi:hypothetical protein